VCGPRLHFSVPRLAALAPDEARRRGRILFDIVTEARSASLFYGSVGPTAIAAYNLICPTARPPARTEARIAVRTRPGVYNGWDCDATHWYKDANGNDEQPRSYILGRDQNLNTALVRAADVRTSPIWSRHE
jgi:hypothetical protein